MIVTLSSIRDFINFTIVWLVTYNYRMSANQLSEYITRLKQKENPILSPSSQDDQKMIPDVKPKSKQV